MIYQYKCENGHIWDLSRKVSERHDETVCVCGLEGRMVITTPALIFNSDSFPSHHLRGDTFWRPGGRNLYFKEHEFLEREKADDAGSSTCVNAAKNGESRKLFQTLGSI